MIIDNIEYTHCQICNELVESEKENPIHLSNHLMDKHPEIIKQFHFMFDESYMNLVEITT